MPNMGRSVNLFWLRELSTLQVTIWSMLADIEIFQYRFDILNIKEVS